MFSDFYGDLKYKREGRNLKSLALSNLRHQTIIHGLGKPSIDGSRNRRSISIAGGPESGVPLRRLEGLPMRSRTLLGRIVFFEASWNFVLVHFAIYYGLE